MPELPEVQTVADDLVSRGIVGKKILFVKIFWPRSAAEPAGPGKFGRSLAGRRIEKIFRRGKFVVLGLSGGRWLLVHLRMTGRLLWAGTRDSAHVRAELRLSGGMKILFCDPRKFGRLYSVRDPERIWGRLGPEPLDPALTAAAFGRALAGRSARIKTLLLDQSLIAGLGNIYADEALWEAKIHPCCPAGKLGPRRSGRLLEAVRLVLVRAIKNRGTSLGRTRANFRSFSGGYGENRAELKAYGRAGEECPRCCRARIRRIVLGQRGTHFCPVCQRPGPRG